MEIRMKVFLSILGTILVIFGILGFSYKYFSYTTNENVAQIGNVKVTAETEKVIFISPTVSAILLCAGIVVVIVAVSRKS